MGEKWQFIENLLFSISDIHHAANLLPEENAHCFIQVLNYYQLIGILFSSFFSSSLKVLYYKNIYLLSLGLRADNHITRA